MYISSADRNDRGTAKDAKEMFRKYILDALPGPSKDALQALLDANNIDWFEAHSILINYLPDLESDTTLSVYEIASKLEDEGYDNFLNWFRNWGHYYRYADDQRWDSSTAIPLLEQFFGDCYEFDAEDEARYMVALIFKGL